MDIDALPRRAANKMRTRNALLRAALTRFAEDGIAGATMDAIARDAKVSRATLFNYFPGKADIVTALLETMDERFTRLVEDFASSELPVTERIIAMFRGSGRELEHDYPELRHLVGLTAQGWDETIGAKRFTQLQASFYSLVHDLPEPARRTVADVLAGTYTGIVYNWRFEEAFPLAARLEEAATFIARSLR